MGAGASLEEEISTGQQPRPTGGQGGTFQRPPQSAAFSRATSASSKGEQAWKKLNALKAAASGLKIIRPGRPIGMFIHDALPEILKLSFAYAQTRPQRYREPL
jgi:hypothetical protein